MTMELCWNYNQDYNDWRLDYDNNFLCIFIPKKNIYVFEYQFAQKNGISFSTIFNANTYPEQLRLELLDVVKEILS